MYIHKQILKKKTAFLVSVLLVWEFTFPHHVTQAKQIIPPSPTTPTQVVQIRLPRTTDKPKLPAKKTVRLTITAYSSTPDQTDGDPFTTASGTKVRDGIIASNFLPMGTKVRIPEYFGNKIFIVEDRMHPRHRYMADIWMPSKDLAKKWGAKYTKLEIF